MVLEVAELGKPLLLLGHVEELAVGGLEQGHAKGQVDAHDPELGVAGDQLPDRQAQHADGSIAVQDEDRREHQGELSDLEKGQASVAVQERQAGGQQ